MIEKNRGKDISKFFHGGYNYEPMNGGWNSKHSNYARSIVNTLIVARLSQKRSDAYVTVNNQTKASSSGTIHNYEFKYDQAEAEEAHLINNIKLFYPEVSMLGKHYLVQKVDKSRNLVGNARQYTVANCMRPQVYEAYVSALKKQEVDTSPILGKTDNCHITLTIKKYDNNGRGGLSMSIN